MDQPQINIYNIENIIITDDTIKKTILSGLLIYDGEIKTVNELKTLLQHYECWDLISKTNKYSIVTNNVKSPTLTYYVAKKIRDNNFTIQKPFVIEIVDINAKHATYAINPYTAKLLINGFYPIKFGLQNYILNSPILHDFLKHPNIVIPKQSNIVEYDVNILSYITKYVDQVNRNINFCTIGNNFGDYLNIYLFRHITGIEPICDSTKPHYLFIGSIFGYANDKSIVCGAGVIDNNSINKPLCITGVRGPYTYKRCIKYGYNCSENYGDPALLISRYYNPFIYKRHQLGIIPHYIDYTQMKSLLPNYHIIDFRINKNNINRSIENIIDSILSCEYIISSSLHGLVMAHAYYIPCMWIKSLNKLTGNNIKFMDHYASLNLNTECQNMNAAIKSKKLNIDDTINKIKNYPQPNYPIEIDSILDNLPFYRNFKYMREHKIV